MPRSWHSGASGAAAGSIGSRSTLPGAASARSVAITIALDPPRPTSRGIVVRTRRATGPGSRPLSAANLATAAPTSARRSGSGGPGSTTASAAHVRTHTPSGLPPEPSDGLPARATRAAALPLAIGQSAADRRRELRVGEGVGDERRAVSRRRANVLTADALRQRDCGDPRAVADDRGDGVGELQFALVAGLGGGE